MKRLLIFLIISILIAGTVSAQAIREQRNPPKAAKGQENEGNSVKVEGILKLEKGFVAVENSDTVYLVPMLNRYIGFITGLREGTKVSVEGYEFKSMIHPTKVTIDGKSYDFPVRERSQTPGFGKQNIYPDNNRRTPEPKWNNRSDRDKYGRDRRHCR